MFNDDSVIATLSGQDSLLDSVLVEVSASWGADTAEVTLRFRARTKSRFREVTLHFSKILEMNIAYSSDDFPADIYDLKFLKLPDSLYYISLDPDPATLGAAKVENVTASDTDGFYIRAAHVSCFAV